MRPRRFFRSAGERGSAEANVATDAKLKAANRILPMTFSILPVDLTTAIVAPSLRFSRRGRRKHEKNRRDQAPKKSNCAGDSQAAQRRIFGQAQRAETANRSQACE